MIATLLILFLYFIPGIVCTTVFYQEIKEEDKYIYVSDLPLILSLVFVSWVPVLNLIIALNMIEEFCRHIKLTEPLKKFADIKLYSYKKTEEKTEQESE